MMCFENARQLSAAAFALGFLAPFTVYAVCRFVRWLAISTVKAIIDGLHRKLFPERKQQPQQQPRHDHNQQRPQQPQNNPNKQHHNGQGQPNQGRPQHWQQPQHQTHGPTQNA